MEKLAAEGRRCGAGEGGVCSHNAGSGGPEEAGCVGVDDLGEALHILSSNSSHHLDDLPATMIHGQTASTQHQGCPKTLNVSSQV